jgi:hypothetical protein
MFAESKAERSAVLFWAHHPYRVRFMRLLSVRSTSSADSYPHHGDFAALGESKYQDFATVCRRACAVVCHLAEMLILKNPELIKHIAWFAPHIEVRNPSDLERT